MGCCGGDREKDAFMKNDVKWEYVVCLGVTFDFTSHTDHDRI